MQKLVFGLGCLLGSALLVVGCSESEKAPDQPEMGGVGGEASPEPPPSGAGQGGVPAVEPGAAGQAGQAGQAEQGGQAGAPPEPPWDGNVELVVGSPEAVNTDIDTVGIEGGTVR